MRNNNFGLTPSDWRLIDDLLIQPLKKHLCKLWVFGSRATGKHQTFSDIDVLYQPTQALPSDLIASIQEQLENSNLSIKVDLVARENLATSFRDRIEKEKILL
ncbi:MAG: nucleotidyltransferase domain-containing protein [Deltaproteobacteria bacterium]|nr:nucleotidyltransferase domain-containing protein [Deltaproteobacteria bacterium]